VQNLRREGVAERTSTILSGRFAGAASAPLFTAASASNESWYTAIRNSAGRMGAIPRTAISLAGGAPAASAATALGQAGPARGSSFIASIADLELC
jgi:hypothetical protein